MMKKARLYEHACNLWHGLEGWGPYEDIFLNYQVEDKDIMKCILFSYEYPWNDIQKKWMKENVDKVAELFSIMIKMPMNQRDKIVYQLQFFN